MKLTWLAAAILGTFLPVAAQPVQLQLGVSNVCSGCPVSMQLTFSGGAPAGLQWSLRFPQDLLAFSEIHLDSSAQSAGKTLTCNPNDAGMICLLVGLDNNTPIGDGPIAAGELTIQGAVTGNSTALIEVRDAIAVSPGGDGIAVSPASAQIAISPAVDTANVTLTQLPVADGSQTISLGLGLAAGVPAGLQWTLNYPLGDFLSVSVQPDISAVQSGKSVFCNDTGGAISCIVIGPANNTAISQGNIAVLTLNPVSADGRASSVQLQGLIGATADGSPVNVTALQASIAVAVPGPPVND